MNNKLWNNIDKNSIYHTNKELYKNHILDQYKIYNDSADKISSRRNLANMFFLTLNTSIFGAIGFSFEKIQLIQPKWLIIFPLVIILCLTIVWYKLLLSYRNINTAKYTVLRQLSKKLPSSPLSMEWKELENPKNTKKYFPLTSLEKYIPILFFAIYFMTSIYLILK